MPMGKYKDFGACVTAQTSKGKDSESAKKICGSLKAKFGSELYQEGNDMFIKAFLLDASVNSNRWEVAPDTLDENIKSYVGKPLVIKEGFDHPMPKSGETYDQYLQSQNHYKIGTIIDIQKKDGIYSAIIKVDNDVAKQAFNAGELPYYVSPQFWHDGVEEEGDYAKTWRGTHLAVVDQPAYGIKKARVISQCNGTHEACVHQLKSACVNSIINELKDSSQDSQNSINAVSDNTEGSKTVSLEEYEKVKKANEELQAKVDSLNNVNKTVSEENTSFKQSLDNLQNEFRRDKIASLIEGCYFKDDETKKANLESFAKSGMTYDEITKIIEPLRHTKQAKFESKLQLKSASEGAETSTSEIPNWYNSIYGGSV